MNYQFIVITLCEDRKQKIIQSFKDLGVEDSSIYYLKASTPENSEEYFIDTSFDIETKNVVCCAKVIVEQLSTQQEMSLQIIV